MFEFLAIAGGIAFGVMYPTIVPPVGRKQTAKDAVVRALSGAIGGVGLATKSTLLTAAGAGGVVFSAQIDDPVRKLLKPGKASAQRRPSDKGLGMRSSLELPVDSDGVVTVPDHQVENARLPRGLDALNGPSLSPMLVETEDGRIAVQATPTLPRARRVVQAKPTPAVATSVGGGLTVTAGRAAPQPEPVSDEQLKNLFRGTQTIAHELPGSRALVAPRQIKRENHRGLSSMFGTATGLPRHSDLVIGARLNRDTVIERGR